ncbi:leucine-rich repeat domain-containing protein [Mesorhizobium sp. 1M-11]|uniref:leucine-rich repeat domain-containing protein n=1 Tax=Mesorhizobium sp. 1M-11 TaxID=1529006 RepID=UPI0006C764C1|nr:leucine-rich repeat domain-containing protein [Mesorhizobium sp. 1M-11]
MKRIAPWETELPDDLTPAQGYQLALDRIAWRAAGRPDPATLDDWPDDDDLDYLLSRHSHDTLDLNSLKLRKVPDELYQSDGVTFLFLMDNRIETIPEQFAEVLRLEELSLFGNPLREVPASLLLMEGLKGLYLGRSALTRLPYLDRPSTSIRTLGLERTEWLEIPEDYLANFPNLRSLLLGHSFRHNIPDEVFGLAELIQLDFEGNSLKALSPHIGRLTKLLSLQLRNCKLETLPKELGKLTMLEEKAGSGPFGLHISGNPFKDKELKRIAKLKNPQQTIEALAWASANGS